MRLRFKPSSSNKRASRRPNRRRGAQAAEFAAALTALILCVVVPLVDFGIIPVRWLLANQIVSSFAGSLSRSETLSTAYEKMNSDPTLRTLLTRIGGVTPRSIKLALVITKPADSSQQMVIDEPRSVPQNWLPDAPGGPFQYELQVSSLVEISPLVILNFGERKIPGLTAPFTMNLNSSSHWENLGRNPNTNEFYLNE